MFSCEQSANDISSNWSSAAVAVSSFDIADAFRVQNLPPPKAKSPPATAKIQTRGTTQIRTPKISKIRVQDSCGATTSNADVLVGSRAHRLVPHLRYTFYRSEAFVSQ